MMARIFMLFIQKKGDKISCDLWIFG